MRSRLFPVVIVVAAMAGCASTPLQPQDLAFQVTQLSGSWAESSDAKPVCTEREVRYRFVFSADGKRLTVLLNKVHATEIGDLESIGASIVNSTDSTLTIAYDGESRQRPDGTPVEWQLVVVAPGAYRWRETSWPPHGVNVVVGVRCGT